MESVSTPSKFNGAASVAPRFPVHCVRLIGIQVAEAHMLLARFHEYVLEAGLWGTDTVSLAGVT